MTIRLRAHHLLCLLTYAGKGYSAAFTANYDIIAERLSAGERIEIVDGPDDICAPLLAGGDPHCWNISVIERDQKAARDLQAVVGAALSVGSSIALDAQMLRRMRAAFQQPQTRTACIGCEWHDLCSAISMDDYQGTRVQA